MQKDTTVAKKHGKQSIGPFEDSSSKVFCAKPLRVSCPGVYVFRSGSSFKYAKPSTSLKALCCHVIFISRHVQDALVRKKWHIRFWPLHSQSAIACLFYHAVLVKRCVFLAVAQENLSKEGRKMWSLELQIKPIVWFASQGDIISFKSLLFKRFWHMFNWFIFQEPRSFSLFFCICTLE